MRYPESVKSEMVRKMMPPLSMSSYELAVESGISSATLSRWRREASKLTLVKNEETQRRSKDWSAEEKLQAVLESAALSGDELGSFLRRKGLHSRDLEDWRRQMLGGLKKPIVKAKSSRNNSEAKKIQGLERELKRKEAALAETAALLVLSKKAEALWGDEDVATTPKRGKKSSD